MSEISRTLIRDKITIPAGRIFLAWLLLVLIPVGLSFAALNYFLDEYAHYSEAGRLAEAYNQLDLFQDALVLENFLSGRKPLLERLTAENFRREDLEKLKSRIDQNLGGETILCAFFDRDCQRVVTIAGRQDAMSGIVLPPAVLLKRQLQFLYQKRHNSGVEISQNPTFQAESRRLSLSLQQLFKTITPVTLKADRAVKNFSVLYGGELYFVYTEFNHSSAGPAGCLTVMRGKEFSTEFMLNTLRPQFPLCRVVSREQDVVRIESNPSLLNSGVARLKDRLLITAPADQRFVRHVIHGGGVALKENDDRNVPFLQYHLPISSLQHQFARARRSFVILMALLLSLSGLYCLRAALFGIELTSSFKTRIMATTAVAAMFPFLFFSAGFYLHLQYDEFLGKINLLQHINARLALFNNELDQYFADLEGALAMELQQIDKNNYLDDAAVKKIFAGIGERIPVSRIFLQRLDSTVLSEFPERLSRHNSNDTSFAIENFFPLRTLQLLLEPEPVARTRQDILKIPGENVKIALIGRSLILNGAFYNLDLADYPVWLANFKVVDSKVRGRLSVLGLVFTRLEPAPLIADFLAKSDFAKSAYLEEYGNYRISYAFFPVEKTGSQLIWEGSGNAGNAVLKKAALRNRSETTAIKSRAGNESFVVSRLNQEIPHIAVALAQPRGLVLLPGNTLMIGLGSLLYLFFLMLLSGKLLDLFFVVPVSELARNAEQIARGGDSWSLKLSTGDELEHLNDNFAQMVKGLQQRNMLKDYVSEEAYSDLAATESHNLAPGGEYRESTILFAAIKDFHSIAEHLTPQQTVEHLNRFTIVGDRVVKANKGSIDKIINQTLMLVFRENPGDRESHALRAARAALQLAAATKEEGFSGIYAGIASGTVISGKIGSYQGKLDFTVIGNPVNLAARLKNEAIDSTTGIIISGSTMRLLKGVGRVNFLRRSSLKGKAREYNIYELIDLRES